ncbi:MAG: 16S rRNA (cytosine(967)-C(5))-methyltransferase RsmB [Fusobacterium mortiferum]|jgi:16S rRNA (cytosine967-C5)-methyltransferase|uniref:16S rRNA (cytosine(967)-C(5))-methyltransferase RsmB n=1 Tax=Fusobacterium sp. FSA-380-WT-2B TaxID=2605786 RepID=UPI0012B4174D|nr:16S rRNA (cytosine(967)-C(5))-methyltransferase RsmB [Fusobacterium sp. FSA-380-WT-2B]MCI7188710.1 16S rRNA (cytosine(967)-C(5))-methyltransferase RsmB [Fusobacterium mortiferum]MDY2800403.1 16S rRNA (cytosine(967)-C(5))-methyltransferase RsmB [Fusobacterium mortiferum]MSS60525.1 16S rRNA (cytosine(967)-C(5))-methyltransferase RsmB [Fusobacterium sp. FSA-380-WT-2B]
MNIKARVISLIKEVENGKFSNIALNEYFKENNLSKKERGFITELFYGVIRNKIFLDYEIDKRTTTIKKDWIRNILRISMYQISFMNSDDKGVIWEATELAKKKFSVPVGKFINGVLRSYQREWQEDVKELKESGKNYIYLSYPEWFYNKLVSEYGEEEGELFLQSLKKIPYISFRVNRLKYSCEEFEKLLEEKKIDIIKKVDSVYYVDSGILLYSDEFRDGKIIVQDASSYLSARNLNPKPDESVLDTCSAPGGKTAVLGELMENRGELLALDIYPHKLKLIEENCHKCGVDIVRTVKMDARKLKEQGKKFDKILVDAPCSGYGVLRKKPETIYNKNSENVEELAKLQFEILESASQVLKDNGELVYSTCTILKEENGENIKKFLEKYPNFETVELYIPENVNGSYDNVGGFTVDYKEDILDGFYIVKLKKNK